VVCFAAAGSRIQWHALEAGGLTPLRSLHPTPYDLSKLQGRLHALIASIHCCKAVMSLAGVLPSGAAVPLRGTCNRPHNTTLERTQVGRHGASYTYAHRMIHRRRQPHDMQHQMRGA
jgi:hypothetical protein